MPGTEGDFWRIHSEPSDYQLHHRVMTNKEAGDSYLRAPALPQYVEMAQTVRGVHSGAGNDSDIPARRGDLWQLFKRYYTMTHA